MLAGDRVPFWRVCGAVYMPRWIDGYVSSFNNKRLCSNTVTNLNDDIAIF